MAIKAAIFDLDGTLIDSLGVWGEIDVKFLAKRGLEVSPDYADKISAMRFEDAARYTKERYGFSDTVEEILREWNELALREYSNNIKLKPFALGYLRKLRENGYILAVATTLIELLYTPVLKNNGIYEFFDFICSTDDIEKSKEHPDIYHHAAKNLGVSPEECVVFEDVYPAIQSAKSAGMTVYAVYDKYSEKYIDEIKELSDGIIYDFKDAPTTF